MENPCPWTPPIFTIPSNSRIDNGKFYPGLLRKWLGLLTFEVNSLMGSLKISLAIVLFGHCSSTYNFVMDNSKQRTCFFSSLQTDRAERCTNCTEKNFCDRMGLDFPTTCITGHYCPPNSIKPTACPPVSIMKSEKGE